MNNSAAVLGDPIDTIHSVKIAIQTIESNEITFSKTKQQEREIRKASTISRTWIQHIIHP